MSLNKETVPLKSYTELHKTLVQEVAKREQHRLNYEKLKALNAKLQIELVQSQNVERQEDFQTFMDKSRIRQDIGPSPHDSFPDIPDIHIDKALLCTPASSHEDPKQSPLDQELQGLETLLRNTLYKENSLERQKSGKFWESSEMISALGQWKKDYTTLYEEYQEYQSMVLSTIESEISAAHEKVSLVEQENGRIRSQFEKEKFDLDSTCRELIREKSSLRYEIRTLREELDETRMKLEEKTAQYDSLSRKMDDSSFSRSKGNCQDLAHLTLDSQCKSAESRNGFLQHEIQNLIEGKGRLHHEVCEMTLRHEVEVEQLNKHIQHLEQFFSQEWKDFEVKYNELKSVIGTQQACIVDMEETIRSKDEESDTLMTGIQSQMRHLMTEALNTITALEEDKLTTVDSQNKIVGDLTKIQSQFNDLQKELRRHQEYSINVCNQALAVLGTTPNNEADFTALVFHTNLSQDDNIPKMIPKESTTVDGKLKEEIVLKKLLSAVINAQEQFRQQRDRLHKRIQELEHNLKLDKMQHSNEISNSLKKYRTYAHAIRKLRKQLLQVQADKIPVSAPICESGSIQAMDLKVSHDLDGNGDCPKLTTKQGKYEDTSGIEKTNDLIYLREKHAYFEDILKKLDSCHTSDV